MAHHVVVLAYQFGTAVTGNPAEMIIGISDDATQIRGGYQLFIGREIYLLINEMCLCFTHTPLPLEQSLNQVLVRKSGL